MAWSSRKRNSFSKENLSDSDSSSEEEENPFVPIIMLRNTDFSFHSNCTNDLGSNSSVSNNSSLDGIQPVENFDSCLNNVSNECASGCNQTSHRPEPYVVKRNNIPNNADNMPSGSNIKLCKSVNIAPVNSPSNQELNCPLNLMLSRSSLNVNSMPVNDREQHPNISSSESRRSLPESSLMAGTNQVANCASDLPIPCDSSNTSKESSSKTMNNSGPTMPTPKAKEEKQSHVQQTVSSTFAGPSPMYNWQASMTTVKERFAFLFNNEVLSDIHFRVGKGDSSQSIPAHRFVLAVGSAVFDAMFNGKLSTHQEEIELPDVEPQAFLSLLRFLYSDEVQIGPETVMTVLYTAKKYAVPALERQCVEYLKCNLSPDNAFMLLTQARLFDEPQLAALCLESIDKNTNDACNADGFTDIDHDTLCLVLERDTLRIREAKLFHAVVRWSESKCNTDSLLVNGANQREVLGRALDLVRFPLMTIEEFAQGPAQSNILTDKEIVQLFLYFTVNPKSPVNFLDVPRCCMTGKEQTVCRFQQIESRWGYSGTSDRIRFIVDRRIFVVGFGMYGSIHGPSEYEVTIQIIHTVTGKVCISNDTSFVSDGTVNTFRVMFKEPFEVLPNTNYTANATLKGPDSHYGTKGLRKLSVECSSGDRVTFQFTYAAGNNNGTSVDDGQIPEIIFYT